MVNCLQVQLQLKGRRELGGTVRVAALMEGEAALVVISKAGAQMDGSGRETVC